MIHLWIFLRKYGHKLYLSHIYIIYFKYQVPPKQIIVSKIIDILNLFLTKSLIVVTRIFIQENLQSKIYNMKK